VYLPAYVNAIAFVIFVLVLLVRPWGILGERVAEKL
jgi:branched-subunit amino acid ABC-type transport system permease component